MNLPVITQLPLLSAEELNSLEIMLSTYISLVQAALDNARISEELLADLKIASSSYE